MKKYSPLSAHKLKVSENILFWWKDGGKDLESEAIMLTGDIKKIYLKGTIGAYVNPSYTKITFECPISNHNYENCIDFNHHCCLCENCLYANIANCFAYIKISILKADGNGRLIDNKNITLVETKTIPMADDIPDEGICVNFDIKKGIFLDTFIDPIIRVSLINVVNIKNEKIMNKYSDIPMSLELYYEHNK